MIPACAACYRVAMRLGWIALSAAGISCGGQADVSFDPTASSGGTAGAAGTDPGRVRPMQVVPNAGSGGAVVGHDAGSGGKAELPVAGMAGHNAGSAGEASAGMGGHNAGSAGSTTIAGGNNGGAETGGTSGAAGGIDPGGKGGADSAGMGPGGKGGADSAGMGGMHPGGMGGAPIVAGSGGKPSEGGSAGTHEPPDPFGCSRPTNATTWKLYTVQPGECLTAGAYAWKGAPAYFYIWGEASPANYACDAALRGWISVRPGDNGAPITVALAVSQDWPAGNGEAILTNVEGHQQPGKPFCANLPIGLAY